MLICYVLEGAFCGNETRCQAFDNINYYDHN